MCLVVSLKPVFLHARQRGTAMWCSLFGSFHEFFFLVGGGEKGGNLEVRHSFLEASRLHVKGLKDEEKLRIPIE